MSSSTVISIVPFHLEEFKPGIYPGFFKIPACRDEHNPTLLVVGDSVYHVEVGEGRSITVKCPSEDIAASIVNDYVSSNLAYSEEHHAAPGLVWKYGELSLNEIKTKFSKELEELRERQKNWFIRLVRMADDDWEKTRQHKFISDMQRYAAKALGMERPWIIVSKPEEQTVKCIACATMVSVDAIVCPNCRCILNMDKWQSLKFAVEMK